LHQIIKKAEFGEKFGALLPFIRVLGIFLFNVQLGTGTSYARAMSTFKIQIFILTHFTDLAAQKAAKQLMTKYHPQNSRSNNTRGLFLESPDNFSGLKSNL